MPWDVCEALWGKGSRAVALCLVKSRNERFPMARTQLSDRLSKTYTIDICRHGGLHVRSAGMPHALLWLARAHTPDALGPIPTRFSSDCTKEA